MYNVGVSELEELWGEDDEDGNDENDYGEKEKDKQEEKRQGETWCCDFDFWKTNMDTIIFITGLNTHDNNEVYLST
jgi:hypothetical protein